MPGERSFRGAALSTNRRQFFGGFSDMSIRVTRSLTALGLATSLWAGALVAVAAPQTAQTTTQKPAEQTKEKSSAAKTEQKNQKAQETKPQQVAAAKPLSEKEDPRLIGKRKINGGLIASMSRGTEAEVAQGRQLAAQIDREAKFVDDPVITEYINRVGQQVVLHSDAKIPFTIKVIDSDEVNAFALPGGFFYVNKGLILAADNEAEVAGVMAHEIAHVAARHAMENQAKGMLAEIGMIAGSIFLGGLPVALIMNGAQFGALLGFMKFNRDAEREADILGVQYLWAAGYDPNSMSTMFEKLTAKNKKKPGTFSKLFETHPQSVERMEDTRALVARFPEKEEYVLNTSEFQRVKARLLRLSNARA
jgi:beta-barrel assembly-enhancing protease